MQEFRGARFGTEVVLEFAFIIAEAKQSNKAISTRMWRRVHHHFLWVLFLHKTWFM